jgi:amino acid transporter/signal transduction histidine kinase
MSVEIEKMSNEHQRSLGWISMAALGLGGANLSLYTFATLISAVGTAAIPLFIVGILVSWLAIPAWKELLLMNPSRVGGIAACAAKAIQHKVPFLASLTGVAYWACTIPGISFSAVFFSTALLGVFPMGISSEALAMFFIVFVILVNMIGITWVALLTIPFATISLLLGACSVIFPLMSGGGFDLSKAFSYELTTTIDSSFGVLTSILAGVFLVAFAAPAFEQGLCYVGEAKEPTKNLPKMLNSMIVVTILYYILFPVIWFGALGGEALASDDLAASLTPLFAPFGEFAALASALFVISNSVVCVLSSLSCASRTFSQISEDGLAPEFFARRIESTDAPWAALMLTACAGIVLTIIGSPDWLLAASNFDYVVILFLVPLSVFLMRKIAPLMERPYKSTPSWLWAGLFSGSFWLTALVFGGQQFGLFALVSGVLFFFAGSIFYFADLAIQGKKFPTFSKIMNSLTGRVTLPFFIILAIDALGNLLAINSLSDPTGVIIVTNIFVVIALLIIAIALVTTPLVVRSAERISGSAQTLTQGTVKNLSAAITSLGQGIFSEENQRWSVNPVNVDSQDEIGQVVTNYNNLQKEIANIVIGFFNAQSTLKVGLSNLKTLQEQLEQIVADRTQELADKNETLKTTYQCLERTQLHLVQSEKMSTLARLIKQISDKTIVPIQAASVAFSSLSLRLEDFKNLMTKQGLKKKELICFLHENSEKLIAIQDQLTLCAKLVRSFKEISADNSNEVYRDIDAANYIDQIMLTLGSTFEGKDIKVKLDIPFGTVIYGQPGAFFQVLSILTQYFVNVSLSGISQGLISIKLFEKGKDLIRLEYSCNGHPISENQIPLLFDQIYSEKNHGGASINMGLARNIVINNMNGMIGVINLPESGLCFTIDFPKINQAI